MKGRDAYDGPVSELSFDRAIHVLDGLKTPG